MQKFFSRLAIILLLGFLIYSAATIISTKVQLDKSDKEIAEAVEKYTAPASVPADSRFQWPWSCSRRPSRDI